MNPLLDQEFLLKLDSQSIKNIFARVTILNWDENSIERIEGKITTGSISIDGNSSMRRTCSLTMIVTSPEDTIIDWVLHTKFKLEIGVLNDFDERYDDIIWFKQGIFIFTSFNISRQKNTHTISLSGKDKMCLLNGDVGGNINASTDFGTEQVVDTAAEVTTYKKVPIVEILKNLLIMYGRELPAHVLINDLDPFGFELLQYMGDKPIFLIYQANEVRQITFDPNVYWVSKDGKKGSTLDNDASPDEADKLVYDTMGIVEMTPTEIQFNSSVFSEDAPTYTIGRCLTGQSAGYRLCPLTYAGDLTTNIGDSVTSVIDKIVNMLGSQYEYFYDIDGNFVFQKKPAYAPLYRSWFIDEYAKPSSYQDYIAYFFDDLRYIISAQNTPQLTKLKNDYSVWGTRKAESGKDIAILYRYAIDKRPQTYTTLEYPNPEKDYVEDYTIHSASKTYNTTVSNDDTEARNQLKAAGRILYEKLYAAEQKDDQDERIKEKVAAMNEYDQKLAELSSQIAWDYRELIYQMAVDFYRQNQEEDFLDRVERNNPLTCINGQTGYEIYYTDMISFWRTLYRLEYAGITDEINRITYADANGTDTSTQGYNRDLIEAPWMLQFYFELTGEDTEFDNISIPVIGDRPKVANESSVKSLYYTPVPETVYYTDEQMINLTKNYILIHLSESLANLFQISTQQTSAFEKMQSLVYENTFCAEKINMNMIPIYYLQPNTRISVVDEESKIDNEYIISKINISLDGQKGSMTVEANRASEEIL